MNTDPTKNGAEKEKRDKFRRVLAGLACTAAGVVLVVGGGYLASLGGAFGGVPQLPPESNPLPALGAMGMSIGLPALVGPSLSVVKEHVIDPIYDKLKTQKK